MPKDQIETSESVVTKIVNAAERRMAWEFFVLFSRLEYALKRSGFLKRSKTVAEADWDAFCRATQSAFSRINCESIVMAIQYYESHPPRKQLQVDGVLRWDDPLQRGETEGQLAYLCRAVGVVRNNLFHGGKFQEFPVSDPSRDERLMKHAKVLLFTLIELHGDVRKHFFEGVDE